jgi:hypothetical protein
MSTIRVNLPRSTEARRTNARRCFQFRHAAFAAVLALGIFLRIWSLWVMPLWADEAESSINALTILEHGYPTSSYLGVPIFENTLIQPWPESPEFEFRDSSYSRKGIAVYHGWFPLYSIAASFKLFGVRPDASPDWGARLSGRDWQLRTFAARAPSVLLGVALMITLFWAGKILGGTETAWGALILTALVPSIVDCNRQARYYSAALLFSALCALLVWCMAENGRWRWFAAGGVVFVLMFHSHMILFVAAVLLFTVRLPAVLRLPQGFAKTALFGAIVFLGIVPWALATGLLQTASQLPKAYHFLQWKDVIGYPLHKFPYTSVIVGGLAGIVLHQIYRRKLPAGINAVIADFRRPYLFVAAWLVISYCSFVFLIPVASFFVNRMPIVVGAPGILLVAMVFAAAARAFRPAVALPITCALSAAFVLAPGFSLPSPGAALPLREVVEQMEGMRLGPDVKLYAMPNNHLVLTFYTGLPFESTAPVRKSFFDTYPGRIVIAEPLYSELEAKDPAAPVPLTQAARATGVSLSPDASKRLSDDLATYDYRLEQTPLVCRVSPAPSTAGLPPFAVAALSSQRALNRERLEHLLAFADDVPVTRGIPVHNVFDIWCAFFYRFVDPVKRMGVNLNYADRLKSASLVTVGDRWAVYDIPPADVGCSRSAAGSSASD